MVRTRWHVARSTMRLASTPATAFVAAVAMIAVGVALPGPRSARADQCPTAPITTSFERLGGQLSIGGADALAGTVVTVMGPSGSIAGCSVTGQSGSYSISVYGNDGSTQEAQTNPQNGGPLSFQVSPPGGAPQNATASPQVVFESMSGTIVNLSTDGSPPANTDTTSPPTSTPAPAADTPVPPAGTPQYDQPTPYPGTVGDTSQQTTTTSQPPTTGGNTSTTQSGATSSQNGGTQQVPIILRQNNVSPPPPVSQSRTGQQTTVAPTFQGAATGSTSGPPTPVPPPLPQNFGVPQAPRATTPSPTPTVTPTRGTATPTMTPAAAGTKRTLQPGNGTLVVDGPVQLPPTGEVTIPVVLQGDAAAGEEIVASITLLAGTRVRDDVTAASFSGSLYPPQQITLGLASAAADQLFKRTLVGAISGTRSAAYALQTNDGRPVTFTRAGIATLPASPPVGYTTSELQVYRFDPVNVSFVRVPAQYIGSAMQVSVDRTGIYVVTAGGPGSFRRVWLETTTLTELWSGPDATARDFGPIPQWTKLVQVAPQQGTRLNVLDLRSGNYAYVDATAVGPSGPPQGS